MPLDQEGADADSKATGKDFGPESTNKVDEMHEELIDPMVQARHFLSKHPMAKMLIALDTHCLENLLFGKVIVLRAIKGAHCLK